MGIFEDIFYPGNPKRRAKLQQHIGAIYNNLTIDVTATNDLVDIINTHLGGNLKHVSIDTEATVRANAKILVKCVDDINKCVKQKVNEMKTKLKPEIFKKLMDVSVSFEDKVQIAEEAAEGLASVGGIVGMFSCTSIAESEVLESIVKVFGETITAGFSAVAVGVFALGIDAIAEAIIGAIERKELNEEIEKTGKCVENMQHMTGPYIAKVEEIKVKIELLRPKPK